MNFLKKIVLLDFMQRLSFVELDNSKLSIRKQCELLKINRSRIYYNKKETSRQDIEIMNFIDEQYMHTPFYGYRRMTLRLNAAGYNVNHKKVIRLMNKMGIEAIYPKPKTSIKNKEHTTYPYLLRNYNIERPNEVWSTDITYIKLSTGYSYLVAIMDWYSRCVLSWELSNSLEVSFCIRCLEKALRDGQPEIFNSDQGSQFTSKAFIDELLMKGIRISMDGRGRAYDNIFIERLWRSLKYENVYLKNYESMQEAFTGISKYFEFYNNERMHSALNNTTPMDIYKRRVTI